MICLACNWQDCFTLVDFQGITTSSFFFLQFLVCFSLADETGWGMNSISPAPLSPASSWQRLLWIWSLSSTSLLMITCVFNLANILACLAYIYRVWHQEFDNVHHLHSSCCNTEHCPIIICFTIESISIWVSFMVGNYIYHMSRKSVNSQYCRWRAYPDCPTFLVNVDLTCV